MSNSPLIMAALLLVSSTGCQSPAAPEPPLARESVAAPAPVQTPPAPPTQASTRSGVDPRLPIVGDPLGLLSRPSAAAARPARPEPSRIDPGALMANIPATPPTEVRLERDPRAVARGESMEQRSAPTRATSASSSSVQIVEKSAREVMRRASQGGARVHVLLLYAAYCKACRGVMPKFVELARHYKRRGVAFTAASVDGDAEAFAAYAPVLQGELEPLWIRSEGTTASELKRVGIPLRGDVFSIPLVAVFAGQNRLITSGNTAELRALPQTLDPLL